MKKSRRARLITNKQMSALEAFIADSRDVSAVAKKTLIWALRETRNLTRPIRVFIPNAPPNIINSWADCLKEINYMLGASSGIRLSYFLDGMGSRFHISVWGLEEGNEFTISTKFYDKTLKRVTPRYDEVQAIRVKHPYGACNGKGEPYITI